MFRVARGWRTRPLQQEALAGLLGLLGFIFMARSSVIEGFSGIDSLKYVWGHILKVFVLLCFLCFCPPRIPLVTEGGGYIILTYVKEREYPLNCFLSKLYNPNPFNHYVLI